MKPAKITLHSGRDRAQAAKWLDKCPLGYTLLFKPPTRSNPQNARMWAFLDDIAEQKEWHGKKRSSEDWKALFTASLRGQEITPNLDGTGFVAFGARTSEMSPEEMGDLLQLIETWGVQNGVTFTDQPIDSSSPGGERAAESSGANGASAARGNSTERT